MVRTIGFDPRPYCLFVGSSWFGKVTPEGFPPNAEKSWIVGESGARKRRDWKLLARLLAKRQMGPVGLFASQVVFTAFSVQPALEQLNGYLHVSLMWLRSASCCVSCTCVKCQGLFTVQGPFIVQRSNHLPPSTGNSNFPTKGSHGTCAAHHVQQSLDDSLQHTQKWFSFVCGTGSFVDSA